SRARDTRQPAGQVAEAARAEVGAAVLRRSAARPGRRAFDGAAVGARARHNGSAGGRRARAVEPAALGVLSARRVAGEAHRLTSAGACVGPDAFSFATIGVDLARSARLSTLPRIDLAALRDGVAAIATGAAGTRRARVPRCTTASGRVDVA